MELNEKQKRFCQEYLIDLNGTQAAIRAGYAESGARVQANRMLTNDNIQQYIQELQEGIQKRNQITIDEIMSDLIEVKNRCLQNVPVMYFDKIDKEWKHEGKEFGEPVYKFDSNGATKVLDLLGKIIGAYEKDNSQKRELPVVNINGVKI
jgi:phage terminase small subunit